MAASSSFWMPMNIVSVFDAPRCTSFCTSADTSSRNRPSAMLSVVMSCTRFRAAVVALSRSQLNVPATTSRCRATRPSGDSPPPPPPPPPPCCSAWR